MGRVGWGDRQTKGDMEPHRVDELDHEQQQQRQRKQQRQRRTPTRATLLRARASPPLLLLLLVALALLVGRAAASFHRGDFVHTSRRAQYLSMRTSWRDLTEHHCPRFGEHRTVGEGQGG